MVNDHTHFRRTYWVLFFSLMVAMLGAGVIAPTIPLYGREIGAGGLGLGLIYSAFSVSRVVFMPMTGRLSDRRGRKIFIVTGLTIYTMASFGYIWSASVTQLVWIRLLHGVGSAMVVPIAAAAIGDISPKGREGATMGTFNAALFLGFGAGPLLGGVVMDMLGMSQVFILMGGMSLVSLLLILLFMPEKRDRNAKRKLNVSSFAALWRLSLFKGLLLFRFSNAIVRGSTTAFLPVFASRLEINASQIGLLVSLNILLTALLQHPFGRLADRMNRTALIVTGNLLTAAPFMLAPIAGSFGQLLTLGAIMGVGGAVAFPAALAVATEVGRDHGMGNIMGYFNMAMSLGMIVGPVVSGIVMDLFDLPVVFILGGLMGILGSILCGLFIHKGAFVHADV